MHTTASASSPGFSTSTAFPGNTSRASFPIGWDCHGKPTQFLTPDFFLPDEDVYIEINTMNQKLVTKKNAKSPAAPTNLTPM